MDMNSGLPAKATKFTGMAFSYDNSPVVQISLEDPNDGNFGVLCFRPMSQVKSLV